MKQNKHLYIVGDTVFSSSDAANDYATAETLIMYTVKPVVDYVGNDEVIGRAKISHDDTFFTIKAKGFVFTADILEDYILVD